ncbi:TPA: hypothetical protein U1680_002039 [Streptococcus suis]|nr:hypothetical protein [Streptococcus suis]NRG53883.1 hypothetical protein [Streptococcus suis]HEM5596848.1 hypothetical protein [Streptococcus suis]HEM6228439.1 hypothetical protein [Streptococcus suis]
MRYRKKPVEVEAVQWNGRNFEEVYNLCDRSQLYYDEATNTLYILNLEGAMRADEGCYIIKGIQGEIYPCKEDIFNDTYEAIESRNIVGIRSVLDSM